MLTEILIAVASVVLVSMALAVLISVAEHFLNNYGQVTLNVNEGEKNYEVEGGRMLLQTLAQEKVFIPSACGGKATCGLCKLRVLEGAGQLLPTEEPYMNAQERQEGCRLACQVKVKNDMKIFIPEELFNIREYITTVESLTDLTHDIKHIRLRLPEGDKVKFKAGQFMQFYTKAYGKVKEEIFRAYSISSAPSDDEHLEFMIRQVPDGIASTYVHTALHEGDEVQVTGPYGDFYLRGAEGTKELIMVAGSTGMAPIASLVSDITEKGLDFTMRFYFSVSTMEDVFFFDEMREFEKKNPNFTFIPSVTRAKPGEWDGETRRIPAILKEDIDSPEGREVYMCGSPGLLGAAVNTLMEIGFKREEIFFDEF